MLRYLPSTIELTPKLYFASVRAYEAHGFDLAKGVERKRKSIPFSDNTHLENEYKPQPLRITIPVPVQKKAVKRARDPKKIKRDLDKEKLKYKSVIIAAKNKNLNHFKTQTYGKYETVPLISSKWTNRKSIGDYFTINPFMPPAATNFNQEHQRQPLFSDYDLDPRLIEALRKCGFTKATNIQHEAIPKMLEFSDCSALVAAETGNGKTLSFLVPLLNQVLKFKDLDEGPPQDNAPYGVVVAPGRELADQIGGVATDLCHYLGLKVRVFKGGRIRKQILYGPREDTDVVVGSMGGLMKLFYEKYLRRDRVSTIALDEIDTLLDDTFKDDLIGFLRKFGQSGQSLVTGVSVLMAGATFPTNFDNYLEEVLDVTDILKISTPNIHRVLYHIPQKFMRVSAVKKTESLLELLEKDTAKKKKTIIFSNKAKTADFLQMFLNENNIECVNFSARHHYTIRKNILDEFMSGSVNIMSCTDLVSRGLDTKNVNHVINYDFPLNPADYIHRVGRVGRVGGIQNGHVTSFVDSPSGAMVLQNLETAVRKNIEIRAVNNNIIKIIEHRASKKHRNLIL